MSIILERLKTIVNAPITNGKDIVDDLPDVVGQKVEIKIEYQKSSGDGKRGFWLIVNPVFQGNGIRETRTMGGFRVFLNEPYEVERRNKQVLIEAIKALDTAINNGTAQRWIEYSKV